MHLHQCHDTSRPRTTPGGLSKRTSRRRLIRSRTSPQLLPLRRPNLRKTIATTSNVMKSASVIAPPTRREPIPARPERADLASLVEPSVSSILRYQHVFGRATYALITQAYALVVLGIFVSRDILLAASKLRFVVGNMAYFVGCALARLGKTRFARRLRKRIEFEIGLTILGPIANSIFLFLLWPGWWVLAAVVLVGKLLAG